MAAPRRAARTVCAPRPAGHRCLVQPAAGSPQRRVVRERARPKVCRCRDSVTSTADAVTMYHGLTVTVPDCRTPVVQCMYFWTVVGSASSCSVPCGVVGRIILGLVGCLLPLCARPLACRRGRDGGRSAPLQGQGRPRSGPAGGRQRSAGSAGQSIWQTAERWSRQSVLRQGTPP